VIAEIADQKSKARARACERKKQRNFRLKSFRLRVSIPGMGPFSGWIVVAVRDMDSAAAWYKQKLELPESQKIEDDETGGLELSTRHQEIKVLLFAGADYPDRPILNTRNAAKAREWLLARGIEVGPVQTDRQGTHFIEMRDLEGNSIEICEEPG
jgi:hypothetical protein